MCAGYTTNSISNNRCFTSTVNNKGGFDVSEKLLTGIVPTEEGKKIAFSAQPNDFVFTFMADSVRSVFNGTPSVKVPSTDGFILGKTHDNHNIAIFLGNDAFKVFGASALRTSAYIVSASNLYEKNLMSFRGISLSGGTLNSIFHVQGLNITHDPNVIILNPKDDERKYHIDYGDGTIDISVRSVISENFGVKGYSITNNNVELELHFDSEQPLSSFFYHYNRIKDILSFLTFRYNVGFEKINLQACDFESENFSNIASVYVRNDVLETKKDCHHNICIEDLGNFFANLVQLFYQQGEDDKTILLGFLPKDDKDYTIMTDAKIREICSALEHELRYVDDIKSDENIILSQLTSDVKSTIKAFRKSAPGLSNDTYNMIFGSMSNWSLSMGEKLCALYTKHIEEITILNKMHSTINDESIRSFVKYRNDITHGKHRTMDMKTAITAHYLCGLVYCCVLSRIGISKEKILELCECKILQ